MGPKADQKKKGPAMQDTRKEASPDWVAEGGIHSAANPNPGPTKPDREKSPVTTVETAKAANSSAHMAIRHAVPEERSQSKTSSEVEEMETSHTSAPNSAAAGELVKAVSEVPATKLQHDVALPQTRSKLVWGLMSSLSVTNRLYASTDGRYWLVGAYIYLLTVGGVAPTYKHANVLSTLGRNGGYQLLVLEGGLSG
ncbi:hypothetical protein EMCRGX_G032165 [Ephydatia muelleri]